MADSIDAAIGKRLRALRVEKGMTQTQLGDLLGVSFQQVQKYEKGTNRIGSGRLWTISRLLNTPVTYFFDGLEGDIDGGDAPSTAEDGRMTRASIQVARALSELPDGEVKDQLTRLIKAVARTGQA